MSIETTGREKSGRLLLVDDEQGVGCCVAVDIEV